MSRILEAGLLSVLLPDLVANRSDLESFARRRGCGAVVRWVVAALVLLAAAGSAHAATVLFAPLDSLEGWTVRTLGPAQVRVAADASPRPNVEIRSEGGTALLRRELPIEKAAGEKLTLDCFVETEGVTVGPQASSTAKLHLAAVTPHGVRHFSTRLTGSTPWSPGGLVAEIPPDATRVVLNVGLEACTGRMAVARLSVRNERREEFSLAMNAALNAEHRQLGLASFPTEPFDWNGIPFQPCPANVPAGDCIRLRGAGHEDWPPAAHPIPVGRRVSAIYLLHGVLSVAGQDIDEGTPCAVWTATTISGMRVNFSLFEGRDVGRIGQTGDIENWKVAWRSAAGEEETVTLGVTRWPLYFEEPIASIACESYDGRPVVVAAISAVEDPPPPPSDMGDDEMEE
ncbi:MAG: hypothetical protein ACOY3P_24045 [Planctomycetota bacterium]